MWQLSWPDYVVFITFLLISLLIGVYHGFSGGKQNTTKEFLVGDRKLSVIPTMLSLMVSFQSAIMFLGVVGEISAFGFSIWPGYCLSIAMCMIITERFIVPVFHPLKLTSLYEYLDLRYDSPSLRKLASFFGILSALLYTSLALYAPCLALKYLSGIPLNVTIPLLAVICIFYTALGGMKAVIWTDVFQSIVMFVGMLIIVIKGLYDSRGLVHIFSTMYEHDRIGTISLTIDPRERNTVWSLSIGFCMLWLSSYGISQASVQRYCATPTLKDARRVILLIIPAAYVIASLIVITGFIIFTHFVDKQCDPIGSRFISSYNLLLPVYVIEIFGKYKGLIGIFISMLYGGSLSSISSSLSGASANTWEDLLKPYLPRVTEFKASFITKSIVVIYGVIAVLFAFTLDNLPGTIIKLATQLMGAFGSPLFGVFIMALCFRKSEYIGAMVGSVFGFCVVMIVTVGSLSFRNYTTPYQTTSIAGCPVNQSMIMTTRPTLAIASGFENIYTISHYWYLPLGASVTIIVGMIVSIFIKWKNNDNTKLADELFINFRRGFSWNDDKYVLKDKKNIEFDSINKKEVESMLEKSNIAI